MSFVMTVDEREAFLAGVHVGVLAVERDGRAPLAVPVWYDYQRGGDILIWMNRDSIKNRLVGKVGRFSFLVQSEEPPYRYVTAEGSAVGIDDPPTRKEALRITERYLPPQDAEAFVERSLSPRSVLVRMRPDKWLSNVQPRS